MTMTEAEICREFKEAKNPGAQVGILADLNVCSKNEILKVLLVNDQDITPAGPRKPGGENDKILQLIFNTLDEIEEEIKRQEKRYLMVVESMKLYGKKVAK